ERLGEVGAACCIYREGRVVVDLQGGVATPAESNPYAADTLQMVWSSTKGVVAVAAHMLAQEGLLDFDAPVVEYWPEFGAEGKERIPVRWLFSHRSGLAAIEQQRRPDDGIARSAVDAGPAAANPPHPFVQRASDPSSLTFKSFTSPAIPPTAFNEYLFRSAEVPAGNGIGNARALARIYAACIGEVDGVRLLDPETVERATRTEARGAALVVGFEPHCR